MQNCGFKESTDCEFQQMYADSMEEASVGEFLFDSEHVREEQIFSMKALI
jgi:hypothetical protein